MIKKYSVLKKEAAYGEFWFIGGQAAGADGDIGDTNHSAMVQEELMRDLVEEVNSELGIRLNEEMVDYNEIIEAVTEHLDSEESGKEHESEDAETWIVDVLGFDKEKLDVIKDVVDPRDYGLKHLGWKRCKGNVIQTWTLTPDDLREIGDGLYDAYSEEAETMQYQIEVSSTGKLYSEVPWEVIDSGELSRFREFETSY